ncbi:MAG: helix-turn-helix transcriptional regulator [Sphingomonas sp.]
MTTYLSDVAVVGEIPPSRAGNQADASCDANADLLQAFGQLANAKSVDLVHFHAKDRTTATLAEWSRDDQPSRLRASALTAAVLEEARLKRPRGRTADEDQTSVFAIEIGRRNDGIVYLVVHFDRFAQRNELVPLMLGLVANLRYAFSLKTRMLAAEAQAVTTMAALDRDKCGVIAVTAEGQIAFKNSAAAAALARGDVVQSSHNMVRPTHYTDAIRFLAALDTITGRQSGTEQEAIIMRLNGNGQAMPMIISIAPFDSDANVAPESRPAALIHLLQIDGTEDSLSAVCQLFGLSPIEVQLARHLFRGRTLTDAAAAMRIKAETARSYLKQIFTKTDTHRQAELIGLFSQYSIVVRNTYRYIAV